MFTKHDDDDDSGTTVVMVMMNSRNVFFSKMLKLGYAEQFCKVFYLGETWSCNLKEEYMSKLTFILRRAFCVVAI